MRYSLLLAAAFLGVVGPAVAQDRTLPAGAFETSHTAAALSDMHSNVPSFQGRSVSESASLPRTTHHKH